jgi:diguanylate cyclase (GGDEF)-like protein/PAS domain S-box-containing protein
MGLAGHNANRGKGTQEADRLAQDQLQRLTIAELRTALDASERERGLLRQLVDQLPDVLFVKDTQSRFLIANRATALDLGQPDPAVLLGKTDLDFYPPALGKAFMAHEQALIASGEGVIDIEQLSSDRSAGEKWFSVTKIPFRDADGRIVGIVGVCHDITERKRAKELRIGQAEILELVASGARLDLVLERLVLLIESQVPNVAGSVLLVDMDKMHFEHGASPSIPGHYAAFVNMLPIDAAIGSCGSAALTGKQVIVPDMEKDWRFDSLRGVMAPFGFRAVWSTPILSHKGTILGTVALYPSEPREPTLHESRLIELATQLAGIAIDRKQAEDRIQFMAHHDALTGLPNRTLLVDRLEQAILIAERHATSVTVIFVDLDNFKLINDSLGHNAGDKLLRTVAKRMADCLGSTDTLVRLGGDEFVLLLADLPREANAVGRMLAKLQDAVGQPVALDGEVVEVTCSMGVANYPGDAANAEALLANADVAMYRAKEVGKNRFQFYAAEMNRTAHQRLSLLSEMREAVEQRQFHLRYQPLVDLRTGHVFGLEALVRWQHPVRGEMSPADFIPAAEESGLIVAIGRQVLREACRQAAAWQAGGLAPITMCVNVSARQFKDACLVGHVSEALAESGLEACHLELELTESMVMQDVDQAIDTMRRLVRLGVKLSIDDFGTGYSSLSALKRFPVNRLKIDKSFIGDLQHDENDRAIAAAVISMGHKLNMRVIAEGVETPWQLDFLRDNDCDEVQGFHMGRPVPAAQIVPFLQRPTAA